MPFKPLPSPPPVKPATSEEARAFSRGLNVSRNLTPAPTDQHAVNDFISSRSLGSLQSIARRIMMDILKSPKGS